MLDGGPRAASATAITGICVAVIDPDDLTVWVRSDTRHSERLMRLLARRLQRIEDEVADAMFTDVPGRVAGRLLKLALLFGRIDGEGLVVMHGMTQAEIAQFVVNHKRIGQQSTIRLCSSRLDLIARQRLVRPPNRATAVAFRTLDRARSVH